MTKATKTKAAPAATGTASTTHIKHYPTNADVGQCQRMLEWFDKNPCLLTEQARQQLGIAHPSGRIMELRRKGHPIITRCEFYPVSGGGLHRMECYVYLGRVDGQHLPDLKESQ